MRNQGILFVSLGLLLGIVADASAAPLDLKHVSAKATWLGHIDIDAMRKSIVFQKAMEKHKKSGCMAFSKNMLGMDPEKDLHGATFYGEKIGKHKGVMILHTKVDRDRIMGMAKAISSHKVTDYDNHQLHSWSRKSRHSSKTKTAAAVFYGEETVVVASSVDELKHAVDVLEGKSPSLTSKAALAGNIPAGTTMLMRAEGISDSNLPDKCKVAKQIKSFRFVTGEHDGKSFFRARAKMTNKKVVGQLNEILEGVRAVGQIHVGDDKSGKRIIDDLRIKPDGTTLTVLWSASADDVWSIMKIHRKFFEEKMKKRRHRYGWGHGHGDKKKKGSKKKDVPPEEDF